MNKNVVDIENDYKSFEVDGEICDKMEIFNLMVNKYIKEGRINPYNFAEVGELYAAVTDYVNGTHDNKF